MTDFVDPMAAESTAVRDAWSASSDLSSDQIQNLTKILELRGSQPRQFKMRETCFRAAGIKEGMRVLEIGCGSGVVTRHLSRIVGPKGHVIGIDVREDFVEIARKFGGVEGGSAIEYFRGDAEDLPSLPEVDAVLAVTLLSHVFDPERVVRDTVSRLPPGTLFLALDQDYQTLLFDHLAMDLTDRLLRHGSRINVRHPFVGRRLPGLLTSAGLQNVRTWSFVYSERDASSYLMTIAERFAALAIDDGIATETECQRWLAHLRERGDKGTFFSSLNYICSFATTG
jgi:SAM-dependent methyltransferase